MRRPAKLDATRLWDYAVKALASRDHSAGEIRRKLVMKAERAEDVAPTLARLKELGYINDKRYADTFASSRVEGRGLGRGRVMRDLRQRAVSPAVAEIAVKKAYAGKDEIGLIENYIERRVMRFRQGARIEGPKELASAYGKLIRAGFSSSNVMRVLKRLAKEPELVDAIEPPDEPVAEES